MNIEKKNTWKSVGVYPTPESVVRDFTAFTLNSLNGVHKNGIEILDLFAGDGRLGSSIMSVIDSRINSLTFLEVRKNAILKDNLNSKTMVVSTNGFKFTSKNKFNLIVSNPPYLAINANQASAMEFDWEEVKRNGRNLYALGIKKGLELCCPEGILSVIAPFGYLRGINSAEFREELEKECSEIIINASSDRTLFDGVNSDIAFQVFKKRKIGDHRKTKWKFAYDDSTDYRAIHVTQPFSKKTANKYVRVGPVVWNRKKEFLQKRKGRDIPIIYGGNITHRKLYIPSSRYSEKQFISRKGIIPTDILSVPFIAIRRTLRGNPGAWKIDSALVTDESIICTAENHVIAIELPKLNSHELVEIQNRIEDLIKGYYFHSGSPNISAKIVGELFAELIGEYID